MINAARANASMEQVSECPLHIPDNAGGRWKGVQHGDLIKAIYEQAEHRKWDLKDFRGNLSRDGADLAASFIVGGLPHPTGFGLSLGIQASNARRKTLRFFVGGVETDTDTPIVIKAYNGSGYTLGFDLHDEIKKGLDTWRKEIRDLEYVVAQLKATELDQKAFERVLFQAGRQKIVAWSRVGRMDNLWRRGWTTPARKYIKDKTAWSVFQLFGRVGLTSAAGEQMGQTYRFFQTLSAGLATRIAS